MLRRIYESPKWNTRKSGLIECYPITNIHINPPPTTTEQNRLEHFVELPKGSVVWWFESTDMFRAKKILGNTACIAGGITNPMIALSQPQDIKEKCRELIEVCGKDGGFILASGGLGNIDKGKQENVRAMIEAVKEYCP